MTSSGRGSVHVRALDEPRWRRSRDAVDGGAAVAGEPDGDNENSFNKFHGGLTLTDGLVKYNNAR